MEIMNQCGRATPLLPALPAVTGTSDCSTSESTYPQTKSSSWEELDSYPPYPLPTRHLACQGRSDLTNVTIIFGDPSAVDVSQRGGRKHGTSLPYQPACATQDFT